MFSKNILNNKYKDNRDLHDLYELIEVGAKKEEIAREFGISEKQVRNIIDEFHKDR